MTPHCEPISFIHAPSYSPTTQTCSVLSSPRTAGAEGSDELSHVRSAIRSSRPRINSRSISLIRQKYVQETRVLPFYSNVHAVLASMPLRCRHVAKTGGIVETFKIRPNCSRFLSLRVDCRSDDHHIFLTPPPKLLLSAFLHFSCAMWPFLAVVLVNSAPQYGQVGLLATPFFSL